MHSITKIATLSAVAVCTLSRTAALPKFMTQIPNGENIGKKLGLSGGGYTDFGKLFSKAGSWSAVCNQKYPGTEHTCGAVLGDPCCKWKAGAKPDKVLTEPNLGGSTCESDKPAPTKGPSPAPEPASTPTPAPSDKDTETPAPIPEPKPTRAPSKNDTQPATPSPSKPHPVTPAPTHMNC